MVSGGHQLLVDSLEAVEDVTKLAFADLEHNLLVLLGLVACSIGQVRLKVHFHVEDRLL